MQRDVTVREVGLRDGLQLVKTFVPAETKLAWARAVAAAGIPEVEVTIVRAGQGDSAVCRCD